MVDRFFSRNLLEPRAEIRVMKPAVHRAVLLCVSLSLASTPTLGGQTIRGRVLAAGDTIGVDGVTITLKDENRSPLLRVQSDEAGFFRIPVPTAGRFRLSLERLGFSSLEAEVVVGEKEMVEVEVRIAPAAIPLDPLVVTARRRIRMGTLDEFYDRMERNRRSGVGFFITREEVENTPMANTTFLLGAVPNVFLRPAGNAGWAIQMREGGGFCTPDYYLDGLPTTWDRLPPLVDIEGVEIYRTRFEHVDGYWPSRCGIVFMWRRSDWGNPFSWSRLFFAGGVVVLATALAFIF
jgi:hypothetical protein